MTQNKTQPTEASVESYLSAISDAARREDCRALSALMTKATNELPKMWGKSIVGFGSYHYKYESGREGNSCLAGFSSRASDITLYLGLGEEFAERDELLGKLGKHKTGKGCLYLRRLAEVDLKVLERLVKAALAAKKRRTESAQESLPDDRQT